MVNIGNDWDGVLEGEFDKEYYLRLRAFLKSEYRSRVIYPSMHDIFNALKYTAYKDVKVVILGQDPYHGRGQAHGLCFSVQKGTPAPPSLQNIFKELHSELGVAPPGHGCLADWAERGVLLLNTVLTVREGAANSHKDKGWELWGANAKSKAPLITNYRHLTMSAAHPSPLSAHNGFFGCGHFRKANEFLAGLGKSVDWEIR